ncbi:MAG: hypothetical protein KME02_14250 [Aphanothece saxicola GSE-SYN-MK-01-06B]|nr:hypothetical protein [Aphanothece saxicola GSE-SYN-MK-01-06B]
MTECSQGIKNIQIHARCAYPIVTAYEFEFLKSEAEVQAILQPCTIYIIAQRPLTYFHNLRSADGLLTFDIADRSSSGPLKCVFDPRLNGFAADDDELLVDIQFYRSQADESEPFNYVAGIQLRRLDGDFLFWLTPQKFIHHVLTERLKASIDGDILKYINYKVHYIGQAFSQEIWNRLTGHEKMQAILTKEWTLDSNATMSSLEISLILLDISGFDEANIFPLLNLGLSENVDPIIHEFDFKDDNESFEKYCLPKLRVDAAELTNEVEAMLVNTFKPLYNIIKFSNYPNIANGTRSAGYTKSSLVLESLPAILSTDEFTQNVILPTMA